MLDELPAIVKWSKKNGKDIPGYLDTILKEGRKLGVYLISAAQDFLVDTIGGTDAVRDCYRTAYSVGGDNTTTNKLLGKTKADRPLGKGIVLLRNASNDLCKEAIVALVPYVNNESLYKLLGPSTYEPSMDAEELDDFELEDAKTRTEGDMQRTSTEVEPAATIKPNIEDKGPKAEDIDIDILVLCWNGGANSVEKLMKAFKMTHHQATLARKRIMECAEKHIEETEE